MTNIVDIIDKTVNIVSNMDKIWLIFWDYLGYFWIQNFKTVKHAIRMERGNARSNDKIYRQR